MCSSYWFRDIGVEWHQLQHCFKYSRDTMSYVHEVGDREVEGRVGYGEGKKGRGVGVWGEEK